MLKESIDVGKILKFTESEIYKEIKEAKLVEKEKPFYITIPAKDTYPIISLLRVT